MKVITKLGKWVAVMFLLTAIQLRIKLPLDAKSKPRAFLIWLVAMTTAAPEVKPTTTEWDTKLTNVPIRARESAN